MLIPFASHSTRIAMRRVARTAQDRVQQEQQQDRDRAAEHQRRVARASGDHVGLRAHDVQDRGRERHADRRDERRGAERDPDRLTGDLGGALAVRAPIRRETSAVAAMPSPSATAYSSVSTASVRPTAATAGAPSPATQKMSTTANTDSIAISSIIGIASRSTARPTGPACSRAARRRGTRAAMRSRVATGRSSLRRYFQRSRNRLPGRRRSV